MIRKGARANVEFAGHYTVPRWGCGTGCNQFVIVDSVSGTVYDTPFSVVELPGRWKKLITPGTTSEWSFTSRVG
jgi:hypothetical protein